MTVRLSDLWMTSLCAALAFGMGACTEGGGDGGADGAAGAGGAGGGMLADMTPGAGGAGGGMGGVGGEGMGGMGGGSAGGGGGMGGMGGAGGAGGGGAVCDSALQLQNSCDPDNDCCDRGLLCVNLGSEAQCLRTCDDNAEVSRCGAREVCIPDANDVPAEEPSPGFCLPGDECVPGQEDLSCGEGAICARNNPATFCFPAGTAGVGDPCGFDPMAADRLCQSGLVCELGTCHALCGEGNSCANEGERCIDYTNRLGGISWKFCADPCNAYSQEGCGEGEACIFAEDDQAGRMLGACIPGESGSAGHGDACVRNQMAYWGGAAGCSAGHICADFFGAGGDTCFGFCDVEDNSLCTGESLCIVDVLRGTRVGLCLGECDTWTNAGCGEAEKCSFAFIGQRDNRDTPVGFCDAPLPGGPVGTGQACQSDAETGINNCEVGHLCDQIREGAVDECVKLCDTYPDSLNGCPPGLRCQAEVFGGDSPNRNIGVCFPQ